MTPIQMVFQKDIKAPAISMSGSLLAAKDDPAAILGWLADTSTERGVTPILTARLH
jgi:hypothetical protein